MKNKKGFTLIELLAVIVILAVILAIAGTAVINSINDSREKTKYIAAREIVDIASAYMVAEKDRVNNNCVSVSDMINDDYLEDDVTNPLTGENISSLNDVSGQSVCKVENAKTQEDYELQKKSYYSFDGYRYYVSMNYILGDANDDGEVNKDDLTLIQQYLAGYNMDKTFNINAADINLDGEVNDLDYVELERKLNGLLE